MTAEPTVIVGDRDEVAAALQRARDDGRLLVVRGGEQLEHGRVRVVAELAPQLPAPRRAWPSRALTAAVVLAGVGLLVGAVWAVVAIVSAVVAWVAVWWPAILGGAVVLALLTGGKGRVHCPGCPR